MSITLKKFLWQQQEFQKTVWELFLLPHGPASVPDFGFESVKYPGF